MDTQQLNAVKQQAEGLIKKFGLVFSAVNRLRVSDEFIEVEKYT